MIKKEQVLAKLDALKAYTIAQNVPENTSDLDYTSYYEALMSPLYNAVNVYFSTKLPEFNSVLKLVVFNMYCHTVDLNTEYDDGLERDVATDIPQYYNDLREIYYAFPWLSISNEEFFSAWTYGQEETSTASEGGGALSPVIPLSNSYVSLSGSPVRSVVQRDT